MTIFCVILSLWLLNTRLKRSLTFLAAFLIAVFPTSSRAQPPADLTLDAANGLAPIVEVIVRGQTLQLELDLSGPGFVMLNGDVAEELGLRANRLYPLTATVGGESIPVRTGRFNFQVLGQKRERGRFFWFPGSNYSEHADGKIGPTALGHIDTIDIRLADATALRYREDLYPLEGKFVLSTPDKLAAREAAVTIDLASPTTQLTKSGIDYLDRQGLIATDTAILIAGPTLIGMETEMVTVRAQGVRLLNRPIDLVGQVVGSNGDEGFASFTERYAQVDEDEDVMVVTAKRRRTKPLRVTMGRGALAGCVRLHLNLRTRIMTLSCAEPDQTAPQEGALGSITTN